MLRTGIVAIIAFVFLVSGLLFFAVRGPGEPTPTAELPAEEVVERIAERDSRVDDGCEELLDRYQGLRHTIYKGELTSVQENNIYAILGSWLDRDDPPTREQIDDLLDHCREGTP